MKVALYARVSKDENSTDERYQEPDNQLKPLREYAALKGWEVTHIYVDHASGADPGRPEFRRMIDEAPRLCNAILVWKLDRFSREPLLSTMTYIQRLRERGVGVVSMTESWMDTRAENPMGDLILAIMSWAASEERRKISERTKAGIAQRRAIGQWHGGRPWKNKGEGGIRLTPSEPKK